METSIGRYGGKGFQPLEGAWLLVRRQWVCVGVQVTFRTVQQLMEVRKQLTPFVRRNSNKPTASEAYNAFAVQERSNTVNLKVRST